MKKSVWDLSNKHSSIHFKVKYLQVSNVAGYFLRFSGNVVADDLFANPEVSVTIESNSIETFDKARNRLLLSKDFFSAVNYPFIELNSLGGCYQSAGKIWELTGELVLKGSRYPITLVVNYSDIKEDLHHSTAQFNLFGSVSRKELGLHCGEDEFGDEVQLTMKIFLNKRN